MAKYTREQRQRAVELYVKYECCAADVIRELGYPSRDVFSQVGVSCFVTNFFRFSA